MSVLFTNENMLIICGWLYPTYTWIIKNQTNSRQKQNEKLNERKLFKNKTWTQITSSKPNTLAHTLMRADWGVGG